MNVKPETLAKRAAFQYRRRDILAYASLRLYLKNQCALRDRWAKEIARELVLNQSQPSYNHVLQFKQFDENRRPEFRDLYMPGPNEIFAETALLAECANSPAVFQPPAGVFSYRLSNGSESQGVFKNYFPEFRSRHRCIARACRQQSDAVVLYTDIRKFYPSVSIDLASEAWSAACKESNLSNEYLRLGMKLLENYEHTTISNGSSLPIGPMFSHLIGNLVLRKIDSQMASSAPGQYFRYVDDFVFVAPHDKTNELEESLEGMLNEIGLELHSHKRMKVTAAKWLEFERNFEDDKSKVSWKTFIGKLKQLMLVRPDSRKEMEDKFRDVGIRIRPIDYSEVVQDSDYLGRINTLLNLSWFRLRMKSLNPAQIIFEGLQLRSRYMRELGETLSRFHSCDSFGKRMCIPRLRFLLSRLGYLAAIESLHTIADAINDIQEVAIFAASFRAIAEHDVSELVKLGPKAVQSVVQPLKMNSSPVRCSIQSFSEEVSQAYAILKLNGVPLDGSNELLKNPMIAFCRGGDEVANLYESSDMYFRELACLHGVDEPDVLSWSLETAFDGDEEMVFDMMDYMYLSY